MQGKSPDLLVSLLSVGGKDIISAGTERSCRARFKSQLSLHSCGQEQLTSSLKLGVIIKEVICIIGMLIIVSKQVRPLIYA